MSQSELVGTDGARKRLADKARNDYKVSQVIVTSPLCRPDGLEVSSEENAMVGSPRVPDIH